METFYSLVWGLAIAEFLTVTDICTSDDESLSRCSVNAADAANLRFSVCVAARAAATRTGDGGDTDDDAGMIIPGAELDFSSWDPPGVMG